RRIGCTEKNAWRFLVRSSRELWLPFRPPGPGAGENDLLFRRLERPEDAASEVGLEIVVVPHPVVVTEGGVENASRARLAHPGDGVVTVGAFAAFEEAGFSGRGGAFGVGRIQGENHADVGARPFFELID